MRGPPPNCGGSFSSAKKTTALPWATAVAATSGIKRKNINFINERIEKCRKGRCTPEEAAAELFKPCMCGIFNTDRAAMLIRKMIEE